MKYDLKKIQLLILITALSSGTLLISNLSAVKLWDFLGIAVDGGLVLFPLSYLLGDITIELFDKRIAKNVILSGFLINAIAVLVFYIVIALPAYPGWDMQEAYAAIFGFSPRIIFGSLAGFVLSSFLNNYLFVKMKQSNSYFAKSFIARALASSVFAHILDSATFEFIAFFGVLPFNEFLAQAVFAYVLGLGIEFILSPVEVAIEKVLKKWLNTPAQQNA